MEDLKKYSKEELIKLIKENKEKLERLRELIKE